MNCQVNDTRDALGFRVVQLQNKFLSLTIYPERGAEIRTLINRKNGIDVLWKAPWSPSRTWSGETEALWMDGYAGGWQDIFPNGGQSCSYKGATLGFHGEASIASWRCELETGSTWVAAHLSVELARSPFNLRRSVLIEDGSTCVRVQEHLLNKGEEELHFMWGQHPAYGAPFLSEQAQLTVPAREYRPEGSMAASTGRDPAPPDERGTSADLGAGRESVVLRSSMAAQDWPGKLTISSERERLVAMGYLAELESGWYELKNPQLGFGVRWDWDVAVFPYVWLWQELRGSFGYPWYGRCYVMGVEPFTSIPGNGLVSAMDAGTAKRIAAGASLETQFSLTLIDA